MGLLTNDYYEKLLNEDQTTNPGAPIQPAQATVPVAPSTGEGSPATIDESGASHMVNPNGSTDPFKQISVQEQTKKFGGPVGSTEYANFQKNRSTLSRLPGELFSTVGGELPAQEDWDKMSRTEQVGTIFGSSLKAVAHAVFAFPKVIAEIPARAGNTVYEGWQKATKDTPFAPPEKNPAPWAGVPSYFKTYEDARAKGMGPLASATMVFGQVSGDALIGRDVGIAIKNSFAPRAIPLKPGESLVDTKPVEQVLTTEQNKLSTKRGEGNPSEYHPLTNTDAKKFGGPLASSGNTFFKFTPAVADGSKIELSIVKIQSGVKNLIDNVANRFGVKTKATDGKFGPEQKIYSQVIDVSKKDFNNVPTPPGQLNPTIPSAPLKGFEDRPVTNEHISNLDAIGKVNNIDPELQSGVVKALTGKDVVGDLTQKEYVNVAQTLSKLNKADQFTPETIGFGNWMRNYLSPTRYWTRDVQEATGVPVHDVHMQLETGSRVAKVSERTQLGKLYEDPIINKYSSSKFANERALVKEYMEGNTAAITDNPSLSPEVKADLINAAGTFDTYLKGVAGDVGMDPKAFIDNYAPHVQERGGVFQLYKESGNVPSGADAFFREKRTGGLYTQINDMWALADIYTRSAYKAKYMGPALEAANEIKNALPSGVKERFASYVQEKLGYGGKLEKIMDSTAQSLNKKLGLNLPPDTARVITQEALSTMYSSAMSQPSTWLRNAFQYPTMGFAQWGSKFMGEAMIKAYSKAGMEEFLKSGFSVDLGVPFGEEITQKTMAGKIRNGYDNLTQGILKPNSWVENRNRAPMYFQTKLIFDDTISKVNSGKLTWTQGEKELGLDKMNQIDANMIRQDLVKGDVKGAFEKLAQNAIDDTQFPYRRGESARFQYGMAGKILTPFMQWPNEYIHTIGKWVTTGQWDKVARLYASSALIARTFSQQYNTDFGKSLGFNPVTSINLSPPPLTVIQNGLGLMFNAVNDNEQAYEKNGEELFKALKLAIPGGAEGSNIVKFYNAYKKGPVGPDGTYAVPDASGRPNYYSFKDLFWQALGMPTNAKMENQDLQGDISKDKFKYSQAKQNVTHLFQDGMSLSASGKTDEGKKYIDQANELISEWAKNGIDISPSDTDFNKFYIPANEQSWNSLPESLKAKYAPRVFTSPNK